MGVRPKEEERRENWKICAAAVVSFRIA